MVRLRAYYPGFLAALFLVLLRIAIGWHFCYEGLWKYTQYDKPFSAEGFFRASSGPFAPYFRSLVPDCDGLEALHRDSQGLPDRLRARWSEELDRYAAAYRFDAAQREKAGEALARAQTAAEDWFRDRENRKRLDKYEAAVARLAELERNPYPNAVAFQRERAAQERRDLDKERRELLALLDGWTEELSKTWAALATPEQKAALPQPRTTYQGYELPRIDFRKSPSDRPQPPMGQLDWLNTLTVYGLIVAGGCLMLGLFTRLAALWCAGFLALVYLSMPPWPGWPANPLSEGHFLFVNKELIELLACLALAALPTHHWVGLDALLFGRRRRRKLAAALARAERQAAA